LQRSPERPLARFCVPFFLQGALARCGFAISLLLQRALALGRSALAHLPAPFGVSLRALPRTFPVGFAQRLLTAPDFESLPALAPLGVAIASDRPAIVFPASQGLRIRRSRKVKQKE
jgi:hypothetical protein